MSDDPSDVSTGERREETSPEVDFQRIFQTTPDRHLLIDADPPRFTMLAASDAYLDLVILEREDVVGRGLFEVFPEAPDNEQHLMRRALEKVVHQGERHSMAAYRYDIPDRDNPDQATERYWSPSLTPFFDDDGDVEFVRVKVEEATGFVLRNRYVGYDVPGLPDDDQLTADHSDPGPVLVVEPDDQQRAFLTSSLQTQWPVETAESLEEARRKLEHADPAVVLTTTRLNDHEGFRLISNLEETETTSVIARVDHNDGRRYKEAFAAGADDVIGSPATAREFLARVQAQFTELALREATHEQVRRQYHQLFMQAPVGIALMEGPDKVFTLSNPAYDEIVDHRDLLGRPLREAFPEPDLQPLFDEVDEVYETGEPYFASERPAATRRDEDRRPYLTFAYLPYREPDGTIRGVAVFAYEVTEQVEMRRAVERENERKDVFLAMLGHELRNPLTPIAHATDLLRGYGEDADAELIESTTDTIRRQLDQLKHHVDRLLDVARIQRGQIAIEPAPVDIRELVAGAVEAVEVDIEDRDQHLSSSVPDDPVVIEVDGPRITQALTNLLTNASQHTPAQGHIELEVSVDDPDSPTRLVLEVRDDGEGIDPQLLPDIFEPFTQDEVPLDRSQGGLGLGLALVKRIVELHGGTISAHSEGRGQGSRFVVELPVGR